MATFYKSHRQLVAERMAASDEDRQWLATAKFAKTSNGYWLAWRNDDPTRIGYLIPNQPPAEPAQWLDACDGTDSFEVWVAYFESGEFETDPPGVLNLQIQDPVTGKWE